MTRRLAMAALAAMLLLAGAAAAAEQTASFDYTGWHCARCGPKIETG